MATYRIEDVVMFKKQLLAWSQQFNDIVWLDSNYHPDNYTSYDAVLAVDAFSKLQTDYRHAFKKLKNYLTQTNDWVFGYLSYDLKNDIEALASKNLDRMLAPELCFFRPKKLFLLKGHVLEMHYLNDVLTEITSDFNSINQFSTVINNPVTTSVKLKNRINKQQYLKTINTLLNGIKRGDVYEANFCQEFYAENTSINPLQTYLKLNAISKAPFAAFLKMNNYYVLSASPERYLKKHGKQIISQPIKGTAKRSKNKIKDIQLKTSLESDEKERAENIMIVDLVRNDLSRTAKKSSVTVTELCKVYSFAQVHQMISTITATIAKQTHPVTVLKTTFPMGSMTGAPKISAMKLIEDLEITKRGIYSGAIGYFTPQQDFDFNVVIRSIIYNSTKKYVSFSVGSAITAKSDPLKEYKECLIKAKAMREALLNKD